MTQSRRSSAAETAINTASGFIVSMTLIPLAYPLFGWHVTPGKDLSATMLFTVASLVRGYWVRRGFNWLHHRNRTDPAARTGEEIWREVERFITRKEMS